MTKEREPDEGSAIGDEPAHDTAALDEDASDDGELTNGSLARIFHEIGDMLEVKGELVFKTVAYHRAADAIGRSPVDLVAAYRSGTPPKVPGVGQAISDKIAELVTTGSMRFYDKLRAEIPPSLVGMLQIPGLGPKTVKQIYEELGIETLEDLRQAAEAGTLKTLKGLSAKTESLILAGIAALESRPKRLLINRAEDAIEGIVAAIAARPRRPSGSSPPGRSAAARRRSATSTCWPRPTEPKAVMDRFTRTRRRRCRDRQRAATRRPSGCSAGRRSTSWRCRRARPARTSIHFTGSKEHNVRLRAMRPGPRLEPVREGLPADRRGRRAADRRCRRAADVRDRGRGVRLPRPAVHRPRDSARTTARSRRPGRARLPRLVTQADLRGDCHTHSEWSDGAHSIETMAEACRRRGYAYEVLTDHSISLAIARGLAPDRVEQQRAIIAELNARFEREEREGTAPPETPPEGFRLLHGCELEVRADGVLDYDDDLLSRFDVVVASVHVSRRQPRAELTRRTLNAIRSPHVDIIAHPSGRMIQTRDDLDLDWEAVYAAAAATGTALEMNGSPHRLDLAVERARRAVEAGCVLTIDSDAHSTGELDYVRWGVTQARRAWVEPGSVLNTRSRAELLDWVAGTPARSTA